MPSAADAMPSPPGRRVTAIALSRDGGVAALGREDGAVFLHRLGGPVAARRFDGLAAPVSLVRPAADGRELLAAGTDGRLLVWDTGTGERLRDLPHPRRLVAAAAPAPGLYATVDGRSAGRLWRAEASAPEEPIPLVVEGWGGRVSDCAGAAGELVCRKAFAWALVDPESGRERRLFPGPYAEGGPDRLDGQQAFSPNGRFLFFYWDTGEVFATRDGDVVAEVERTEQAAAVAVSDDGGAAAIGSLYGELRIVVEGRLALRQEVGAAPLTALDLDATGARVAFLDEDGTAGVLAVADGALLLAGRAAAAW